MKNLWMFGWMMTVVLLVGCAESKEVTQTGGSSLPKEMSEMPLKEQATVVDLVIDGEIQIFDSDQFPILFQYVSNLPQPKEALRSLPFQKVGQAQYMASFACHEEYCSHILLDFEKGTSYLLSDLSKFIMIDYSQSKQYAAFLFERILESGPAHQVTVMDLFAMEPSTLELNEEVSQLIPQPNQFMYSISDMVIISESEIQLKSSSEENNTTIIETTWTFD